MGLLTKEILIFVEINLCLFIIFFRRQIFSSLNAFFCAKTHPLNLSIFRIVIFALLLTFDTSQTFFFSQFPDELMIVPRGLHWIIPHIPIDRSIVIVLDPLFKLFCLLAVLGLKTRLSAAISTVLALYMLGVPQLFGKINHYHHLIWFAMILSVSPCGDVFSLDNVIRKRKGLGIAAQPSGSYALPLRFSWILVGYLYFSAGFWKWWVSGLNWIFSDNLMYRMYFRWMELPGWEPIFRIDRYPALYQFSAGYVIFFELSFIFFLFSRRLRWFAVFNGLVFHNLTWALMNISFYPLQFCYVMFFDWHKIIVWIKKKFFSEKDCVVKRCGIQKGKTKLKEVLPVIIVGSILIGGNSYAGAKVIDSWPFTCYPTFANYFWSPYTSRLEVFLVNKKGEEMSLRDTSLGQKFSPERYYGLLQEVYYSRDEKTFTSRIKALVILCIRYDPESADYKAVKFYKSKLNIVPESQHLNPIKRELVFQVNLRHVM